MKTIQEVYDELRELLDMDAQLPPGADEYFEIAYTIRMHAAGARQDWPSRGKTVCYARKGDNEGYYVNVGVLRPFDADVERSEFVSIFAGKTFSGADAAFGFARQLHDIFDA